MPSKGFVAPKPSPLTKAREAWAKSTNALRNMVRSERVDLANQCIYALRNEGKYISHRECAEILRGLERAGNSVNDDELLDLVRARAVTVRSVAQELLDAAVGGEAIAEKPPKAIRYFADGPKSKKQKPKTEAAK